MTAQERTAVASPKQGTVQDRFVSFNNIIRKFHETGRVDDLLAGQNVVY